VLVQDRFRRPGGKAGGCTVSNPELLLTEGRSRMRKEETGDRGIVGCAR